MFFGFKIDEFRCFVNDNKFDFILLMEIWIYDDMVVEYYFYFFGYNLCLKNCKFGVYGGVGFYINNIIKYKVLIDLYYFELEVFWVYFWLVWLLRGFFCVVLGIVYYILYFDGVSDVVMIDYFIILFIIIEGCFFGCGIILFGDFNWLNINWLLI